MSNLELTRESGLTQLVNGSLMLIDESADVFAHIVVSEVSEKDLNRYANSILKNIESATNTINALEGIASEELTQCRVKLQQSVDRLYTQLIASKNEWQQRLLLGEADPINYANFCHALALKLIARASQSVVELPQPTHRPLTQDEMKYL